MDVPTLIRKVQRRFGDSNQIFITEADLIDWINEGQLKIARDTKCLTASSSAAANTYPLDRPTDCLKIERLLYGTLLLGFCEVEDLDSQGVDLTIQSSPVVYYLIGEQVNLFPDPVATDATVVKVQYSKLPTTITITANPLTIPIAFHEDLVTAVLIRAHERNENWKAVEVLTNELNSTLALRLEDTNVPDDTFPVVREHDDYYSL